ncbi:MAG: dihydropteroate synthase [Saprospiraceae bacterium]
MGILNLDPDSFYKESIVTTIHMALKKVETMLNDGLDILDIGAFTSRPGTEIPDYQQERQLLMPFLNAIRNEFEGLAISVDTMNSLIAQESIEFGADIINDISGGIFDPKLPELVKDADKIYIAMHMRGIPKTMQSTENTSYQDVVTDLIKYFSKTIEHLKRIGLHKVIIDPGFGFSKKTTDNFLILKNLECFQILSKPILVGISRKSMIYKNLNLSPETALIGSVVAEFYAVLKGCSIVRVHDVKETKQMLSIYKMIHPNVENKSNFVK